MGTDAPFDRNNLELPFGNDYEHEGTRNRVTRGDNPWGLPVGSELEEVRRGEYWDQAIPWPLFSGDCWVWLRRFIPGSPRERGFIGNLPRGLRSRPVLVEKIAEIGMVRTWVAPWLERLDPGPRATSKAPEGLEGDSRAK
jgi:hypothetical protein